ncbi:Wzz/FepE/Etk N-terminal domain-containing protein [Salisaeta longa]|uniref:Wzz/FepE/Etk N-terminal domain-containing protein n=1 Tax=Salisaeta longa TaxID=503170 RepID=UPI000410DA09|nr:Wzz/FepE/Etk N-terminal domain-containing protein [Salisaeta longa]
MTDRTAPEDIRRPEGAAPPPAYAEEEVSLLDLLLVLARHKTLIVRTVMVFAVLGVTYALLAPEEFTSSTKVVRETGEDAPSLPGGLSALGSSFGISLGGLSGGLSAEAYPEILASREVRLDVARDTFYFPDIERRMTFVDYIDRPPGVVGALLKYTLKLPWTLKEAVTPANPPLPAGRDSTGTLIYPTEAESEAIKAMGEMIASSVNAESGLMTISVTAGGPVLSARMAQDVLDALRKRVRALRTQKVRENLQFIQQRFAEAQQELKAAENRLAEFLARNQRINSPQLEFQRDRLQRQVTFKEQLYSNLQAQLTQTRLDLQKQQPVITVVEEPSPPLERSAPKRTLIVLLSIILGGFVGVGFAFVGAFLNSQEENEEEQEKLEEIKDAFDMEGLVSRLRSLVGRSS